MNQAEQLIEQYLGEEITMSRILPELDRLAEKYSGERLYDPEKSLETFDDYEVAYAVPSRPLAASFMEVAEKQVKRTGARVNTPRDVDVSMHLERRTKVVVNFYDVRG